MSTLSKLKLCATQKSSVKTVVETRRDNMMARIEEQIKIADAHAKGQKYSRTSVRNLRDETTGEQREQQVFQYPKPWWWVGEDGKVYLHVKYGARTLELAKGKSTIEVGATGDIASTLTKVKQAVENKELDALLASVPSPIRQSKGASK